jgi:hypothetical protein
MVLQRYNTLQTHWQRVCREIERGTFKRHVERAEKRFARRSSAPPPPSDALFDLEFPASANLGGLAASLEVLDSDLAAEFAPPPARPPSPSGASPARDIHPAPRPVLTGPPVPLVVARSTAQPLPSARPVAIAPRTSLASPSLRPSGRPPLLSTAPRAPADSPVVVRSGTPAGPPSVPSPPSRSQTPGSPADLSDQRLRELYSQLVDSRRKQHESTANITFDSVARTLRESGAKLRLQHGRVIDFEVVVRDGRTVLRPILK